MHSLKKILSFLLAVCFVFVLLPVGSSAANAPQFTYNENALRQAISKTETYLASIIPSQSQISSITSTWQSQFSWDNEKRESAKKSYLFEWSYYNGVVFEGLDYVYDATGNRDYYNKVNAYLGAMINGNTTTWKNCSNNSSKQAAGYVNYHGVDCYKTASLLLDYGYTNMARTLYQDLKNAQNNSSWCPNPANYGYNYRHTWTSAPSYYVWLDGLYMVQPFMAKYASYSNDTAELNKIAGRFAWIGNNMYNSNTHLYYHAANSASDHSAGYWLRAIGWYAAAMADVIPYMTGDNRTAMINQFKRLVDGMLPYQDAGTGMWHNYVDSTVNSGATRLETSGTALMAYAMMKAINNGWLDNSYAASAAAAFTGICSNKLNNNTLSDICVKGSPGATGTNSTFKDNEGKGLGPFIMAYAEMLKYLANPPVPTATGITLNTAGAQTVFHVGSTFTSNGLTVTASYSNNTTANVTNEATVSAPNMNTPGTANVTVTWDEFSATYPITITAHSAGSAVTENYHAATCEQNGSYELAYYCTSCGTELSRETVTIPASGHNYTSAVTLSATCEADGVRTHTCASCGASYTTAIPATGHSYDNGAVTTAPTCEADGVKTFTCANCGGTYTTPVPAVGHSYDSGTVTTEPTCTENGVKTFTCANCGGTYTEAIPAIGHTPGNAVTENYAAPTCEVAGSYDTAVYCVACGTELSRETTAIPAGEHDYAGAVTTAPTCTLAGIRTFTCTECGGTYTEAIPATGHSSAEAVTENYTAPTCTAEGSYDSVVYCSVCEAELNRVGNVLPANGHTPGEAVTENYTLPGCETAGGYENAVYCSVCDAELSREFVTIPATGHSYTSIITLEPTCTEPGTLTYSCPCGSTYTEPIAPNGHTRGEAVTENYVAPTCTAAGSYDEAVYCAVCGEELTRTAFTLAENGHSYTEYTAAATCVTDGSVTYVCTVCGDTYTEVIPALGHPAGSTVTENEIAATCTAAGSYDTVTYCTVCGEELDRVTVTVPSPGHNYHEAVVQAASCTVDGIKAFTCSVCGDVYYTSIPAAGHNAGTPVTENYAAATCTAAGHYDTVTYCTVCGEELNRTTTAIPTVGHTAGTPVTENYAAATCTAAGHYDTVTYCTVCGEELDRTTTAIPAVGHSAGTPVTENNVPATCTTSGHYDTVTYCTSCHAVLSRTTTNVPATGHSWDNGVITTQPTNYNTGIKTFTCFNCGATYTEVLPVIAGVVFLQDTNGIDSGSEYVIRASSSDGNTYALGVVNGSLRRVQVTVSGGRVVNAPDSVIWYANWCGNGYQLQNKSNWMFLSIDVQTSYSNWWGWWGWGATTTVNLTVNWNPTVWSFTRSSNGYKIQANANNTNYYLRYSNNSFEISTSSGTLYAYKRQY